MHKQNLSKNHLILNASVIQLTTLTIQFAVSVLKLLQAVKNVHLPQNTLNVFNKVVSLALMAYLAYAPASTLKMIKVSAYYVMITKDASNARTLKIALNATQWIIGCLILRIIFANVTIFIT